jgi:hypothetical protein
LLRTQFSSALEPRNFFLLVADIYRGISLLPTKIQTYITNDNRLSRPKKSIQFSPNYAVEGSKNASCGFS